MLPSVIFGIEHCYQGVVIKAWLSRRGHQGVAGAGQTTPIGLLLATMLLATGNLLLPMAVHAMLNARDGASSEGVCPCGGEGRHQVDRSKIPILNAGEIEDGASAAASRACAIRENRKALILEDGRSCTWRKCSDRIAGARDCAGRG